MRPINRIILHHSLTRDSGTVSWPAIRRYHTETMHWSDIGYHSGCELIGRTYECLVGRPINRPGAHTKGYNEDSLGFCFVGNYDETEPPKEMWNVALERVIMPWLIEFNLNPDKIFGHCDFANKSCPGLKFNMREFRNMAWAMYR